MLDVQRDPFGAWSLIREWGRIGSAAPRSGGGIACSNLILLRNSNFNPTICLADAMSRSTSMTMSDEERRRKKEAEEKERKALEDQVKATLEKMKRETAKSVEIIQDLTNPNRGDAKK
jgi:hypothetical protein